MLLGPAWRLEKARPASDRTSEAQTLLVEGFRSGEKQGTRAKIRVRRLRPSGAVPNPLAGREWEHGLPIEGGRCEADPARDTSKLPETAPEPRKTRFGGSCRRLADPDLILSNQPSASAWPPAIPARETPSPGAIPQPAKQVAIVLVPAVAPAASP